jgi:ParB family transcriptional regulator, chromosome partitioning protein
MGRLSKRSMPDMFSSAITVQENETIAQLKAEIEGLKSLASSAFELSVSSIIPLQLPGSLKQPRLYFDPQKMDRLKDSINKHGVLEPILVRPGIDGRYEIISGERRWRCCSSLKKQTIPAIVREMEDSTALEAALIAHLLNEEITVIEQSESILSLLSLRLNLNSEEVKNCLYQIKNAEVRGNENSRIFTQEELSTVVEILGEFGMKLSSFVSNRLPMLNLAPNILDAVRNGLVSPTNAVIINRQPFDRHDILLEDAQGLTKQELMALIKSKSSISSTTTASSVKTFTEQVITDRVLERIKAIKKNKKLLDSPKAQKRFIQIERLLEEIESLSSG